MNQFNVSSPPVDVSQMVRKHHTGSSVFVCDLHFECVALGLAGCGAQDAQSSFPIVALGAYDQRWTPTGLFVTRCGTGRNPDPIATVGNIGDGFPIQSSTSRPTSDPKSVSPCNWEGLQFLSNSPKLSLFRTLGRTTNSPARTCNSTAVPSQTSNCPASACGMRIAKLFPHFCTVDIFRSMKGVDTMNIRRVAPLGKGFTDDRIKAAVIMSPSGSTNGNTKQAFGSVKIPWMLPPQVAPAIAAI